MEALIILIVIAADLLSKHIVQVTESLHNVVLIDGFFHITYAQNTGMAWSMLSGQIPFLSLVSAVAIGAMLYYLYVKKPDRLSRFALALMIAGIVISAAALGALPWVTVSLAVMFAVYAAIKKSLTIDSIVSTSVEILLAAPFMLAYLLIFRRGPGGLAELTPLRALFLLGGGIVTGLPMLLYSVGVRRLKLMTVSIGQYISPTLGVVCSLILRESITREKLWSLAFIWAGILIYAGFTLRDQKRSSQ